MIATAIPTASTSNSTNNNRYILKRFKDCFSRFVGFNGGGVTTLAVGSGVTPPSNDSFTGARLLLEVVGPSNEPLSGSLGCNDC